MNALNHRFPDDEDDATSRNDEQERHDWCWKAIVAFAVVPVVSPQASDG